MKIFRTFKKKIKMESKTTRVIALIAFGVSMFVLGWVLNCSANKCSSKKSCGKQWNHRVGEIDIHAFVGDDFEGDTVIISTGKGLGEFHKKVHIKKYIDVDGNVHKGSGHDQ